MLLLCPKCKRKRRFLTVIKTINKKKYWAQLCIDCKAVIELDDYEDKKDKRK